MTPFDASQKLVRCDVVNRYREASVRLVEIDQFKMWEYLMTHKHGLQVTNPTLCLWVGQRTFDQNRTIFERSGETEEVDKILLELFDEEYGFSQTSVRYVRRAETDQIKRILLSHVPQHLRDSDACSIQVIHGTTVQHHNARSDRPMLTGLGV